MVKTPEDVFEIINKECAFDGVFSQDNKYDVIDDDYMEEIENTKVKKLTIK